jgi:hypothetical protein
MVFSFYKYKLRRKTLNRDLIRGMFSTDLFKIFCFSLEPSHNVEIKFFGALLFKFLPVGMKILGVLRQ